MGVERMGDFGREACLWRYFAVGVMEKLNPEDFGGFFFCHFFVFSRGTIQTTKALN